MHIILIDDSPSELLPFTFLKASWDIARGGITLRQWLVYVFPDAQISLHHGTFQEVKSDTRPTLALNGRIQPSEELEKALRSAARGTEHQRVVHGDELIYIFSPDGALHQDRLQDHTPTWRSSPLLRGPWDIIRMLPGTLTYIAGLRAHGLTQVRPGVYAPAGIVIPATVITKTDDGPIVFGEGIEFGEFIVLRGPLVFGSRCKIRDGAIIQASGFGDWCKVGGEIEHCVFDSYSNKQHHGFFGHTVAGSWVNIGAGATTSDLKHTYGSIRVDRGFGKEETGLQFCGSFIGEGSRIAVNASLMAGSILGANVFAFGTVRGYIPSFSSSTRHGFTEIPFEVAWHSRKRAMERRGVIPAAHERDAYAAIYERTAVEREKRNVHRGMPVVS